MSGRTVLYGLLAVVATAAGCGGGHLAGDVAARVAGKRFVARARHQKIVAGADFAELAKNADLSRYVL